MKNKEKHIDFLINLAADRLAVTKDGKVGWCSKTFCENCIFDKGYAQDDLDSCEQRARKWLEEEYFNFSEEEKVILKGLAQDYKYIVRDEESIIVSQEPIKFKKSSPNFILSGNSAILPIIDDLKWLKNHRLYSIRKVTNGIRRI